VQQSEPVYRELATAFGPERLDMLLDLLNELRDTAQAMTAGSGAPIFEDEETASPRRRAAAG
jgi:hypothetical protein